MRFKVSGLLLMLVLCSVALLADDSRIFKGSNSHINDIIQDHRGYIWIATDNGLTRYDGYNATNFSRSSESPSLLSNLVLSVAEDSKHNLWVGTSAGIQKFNRFSEKFETPRQNYPGIPEFTYVNSIIEDSNGNIWFTTSRSGLVCFPGGDGVPRWFHTTNSGIASDKTTVVFEDKFGNIWVGTNDNGITLYNPVNHTMTNFSHNPSDPNSLSGNMIHSISQTNDGRLYIASLDGGIDSYDYRTNRFTRNAIPVGEKVFVIWNDADKNALYIGTDGKGAYVYHPSEGRLEPFSESHSDVKDFNMNHAKVHDIIKDRDGNIWMGIYQKGLLIVPASGEGLVNYGFNPFDNRRNIGDSPVLGILKDKEGALWIATDGDGIYKLDDSAGGISHFSGESLPSDIVLDLYQDKKGRLWAATYFGGLAIFNPSAGRFVEVPLKDDDRRLADINTIAEDEKGNLWLATNGSGLVIYNPDSGQIESFKHKSDSRNDNQLAGNSIHCILFSRDGKAWIGTSDAGISLFDMSTGQFEQFNTINRRLNSNTIYSIVEDPNGNIWVGTALGLVRISEGNSYYYNDSNGISENPVYALELDNDGNVWFSNPDGISKFSIKDQRVVRKISTSRLDNREFKRNASYVDADGRLYFGGVGGVTSFLPKYFESSRKLHNLELLYISYYRKQDGNEVEVRESLYGKEKIQLNHSSNTFTVSFGAFEFGNPDDVEYQVKLDGYRDEWESVPQGLQSFTFSKVPPGKYTLHIKAILGDSVLEKSFVIVIRPPFYLSVWAKILYTLLIIAAVFFSWLLLGQRNQRKMERMRIIDAERNSQEKLRFFTDISHEVRTPLSLILGPLSSLKRSTKDKKLLEKYEMMESNGNRIMRMIDQILDLRKFDNHKMSLHLSETDLRSFLPDLCNSFKHAIDSRGILFSISIADNVPELVKLDRDKIDKVVFNVIANAIRFTPQGGRVDVYADIDGTGNLRIRISDTGPGIGLENPELVFERFFQAKPHRGTGGTGIGLHLSKKMMEAHHGRIFIEDTSDKGTTFTIIIPLSDSAYTSHELDEATRLEADGDSSEQSSSANRGSQFFLPSDKSEPLYHPSKRVYTILIVEDDSEIINYLRNELRHEYNILTASDGESALQLVIKRRPHCVVTDIMMPSVDGLELCWKIRSNVEICDIPVVMLSAKTSENEKIEGIEAGADAYIGKPFNVEHLKAVIANLIHSRQIIARKLANSSPVNDSVLKMKTEDQKLMEKLEKLVVEQLANPELNVEFIASHIGVSRSHLHRRLREIANTSPTLFIRNTRMRHAAILLIDKKMSVSETAFAIGYNSLSHFSTAFKAHFGMSPSQYIAINQNGVNSENTDDKS